MNGSSFLTTDGSYKNYCASEFPSHRIHGTGIFTHIWLIFYGKYRQIYHPMGVSKNNGTPKMHGL